MHPEITVRRVGGRLPRCLGRTRLRQRAAFTWALALALTVGQTPVAQAVTPRLSTVAERSGFQQTGRYDEVIALCRDFAQAYPAAVRCEDFGITPEGRPMKLLVATRSGARSAADAARRRLPVVLIQGGIHAGEIDGKDAGFLALRELLDGSAASGALDKVVLLFVPVFNVDGHERFKAWNRPNQRGPAETGWRVTASNLNLNRDYMKADAPEMQAMLRLINRWDPILYADLHVTDGAQFEHDISFNVEPVNAGDTALQRFGRQLRADSIAALTRAGSLPLPFYPSFVSEDDPASGFEDGVAPPRFSQAYIAERNRLGILVETHSWKDYPARVRATRNTIVSLVEQAADHGQDWLDEARRADARAAQLGGTRVPIGWEASEQARMIAFRGYAYTRTPSDVSGGMVTRYDETRPEIWTVPLRDDVRPSVFVEAPRGGYWIPAGWAETVAATLRAHGIRYTRLATARPDTALETFRADTVTRSRDTFEGHTRFTVTGAWKAERRALPAGLLFVPIAQPLARLVIDLLEPAAPDSLAAWGRFATAFEQKEYMEPYVAEAVARDQLAADPALKAVFEQRLKDDAAFAASPAARLDFFYRRHPAWDERLNLLPVYRSAESP